MFQAIRQRGSAISIQALGLLGWWTSAVRGRPRVQRWLNSALSSRLYPLAAACFGSAVAPAEGLFVYRSLVVQYDAAASLTRLVSSTSICLYRQVSGEETNGQTIAGRLKNWTEICEAKTSDSRGICRLAPQDSWTP